VYSFLIRKLLTDGWDADPAVRPNFTEVVHRMDGIILEAAIEDPVGREFWSTYFPSEVFIFLFFLFFPQCSNAIYLLKHEVSFKEFCKRFFKWMKIEVPEELPIDPEENPDHPLCLIAFGKQCMKHLLGNYIYHPYIPS
jgi:hypothetical protein